MTDCARDCSTPRRTSGRSSAMIATIRLIAVLSTRYTPSGIVPRPLRPVEMHFSAQARSAAGQPIGGLRVPLEGELNEPIDELRIRQAGVLPQLRIHAGGCESGDRVDL